MAINFGLFDPGVGQMSGIEQARSRPKRVSVVGTSGVGKTTFASQLAAALGVPHIELDALHWGPHWQAASADEMRERVSVALAGKGWVVDGNYRGKLGNLVWQSAEEVIWLDLPRWQVMWQCLSRTLRRAISREELWSGNRESFAALKIWRKEESILWWAWTSHPKNKRRYRELMADPANAHLDFVRLTTRRQIRNFLADSSR